MNWLHRYTKLVVAATVLLIAAGGMVTSTGSGPVRARLADDVRLVDVLVSVQQDGWAGFSTSTATG